MDYYTGTLDSPFNPNQKIDSARLYVSSDLVEIEFSSLAVHSARHYYPIKSITGIFNGFGKILLVNCQLKNSNVGSASRVYRFRAKYLFKGNIEGNLESLVFDQALVILPGLIEWTNLSAVDSTLFSNNKISFKNINPIKLYDCEDFSIELFINFSSSYKRKDHRTTTIKEYNGIVIKSNKFKLDVWEYLSLIENVKRLLFFLSNMNLNFESVNFRKGEEIQAEMFSPEMKSKTSFSSMMSPELNFEDIEFELKDIIDKWINEKEIHTSVDLILEKAKNNKLSRENYFLNSCFALEIFHRRFMNYKLFESNKIAEIKETINNTVQDKDIKTALVNSLSHVNDPNFRKRLESFSADLKRLLHNDWNVDKYIGKIVKTRNYLVHRGSSNGTFESFEMLYAAIFVETLVKINIYRILKINEDTINRTIDKSSRLILGYYKSNKRMSYEN